MPIAQGAPMASAALLRTPMLRPSARRVVGAD